MNTKSSHFVLYTKESDDSAQITRAELAIEDPPPERAIAILNGPPLEAEDQKYLKHRSKNGPKEHPAGMPPEDPHPKEWPCE